MNNRDPIRSLTWAVQRALADDLDPVSSPLVEDLLVHDRPVGRRPRREECDVVLFGQSWTCGAIGYHDGEADEVIEQDTTVVVGPCQDAAVYVSTQLLYHVRRPNRRFWMDVMAHCLLPKSDAALYDGRDDAVTESLDVEIEATLARLHAEVRTADPRRVPLIARYLHRCASRFEQPFSACSPEGQP